MENNYLKIIKREKKKKNNEYYSTLLKRKRIEKHLTLEELSKGICTVSYLSRIENNIVDVGEEYYSSLFKKLDIDFKMIEESKDYRVLEDLLKCYLHKDKTTAISLINDALGKNFYVEIEYELMVLFDSIVKNLFVEANLEILKLSNKMELLLEDEVTIYLFLCSLYAYLTGNGIYAAEQITILCEMDNLYGIYRYAVLDLALDIYMYVGLHEQFFKYYNQLIDDEYSTNYNQSSLKHKIQLDYLEYRIKKDNLYSYLIDLRSNILASFRLDMEWLILRNMYRLYSRNEILKHLDEFIITPRVLAFEGLVILKSEKKEDYHNFLNHKLNVKFEYWHYCYERICDITIMIKQGINSVEVLNSLKELIDYEKDRYFERFFLDIIKIIYLEYALAIGKYKDVAVKILDIERTKYALPYFNNR